MVVAAETFTVEDLMAMPDNGMRHELVRGELIEMGRPGHRHGRLQNRIAFLLTQRIEVNGLGTVLTDVGTVIVRDPDTVLGPDVAVFVGEVTDPGDEPEGYLERLPDVVVEIVSPRDPADKVAEKVELYLESGVKLVITVWPKLRLVIVKTPDGVARDHRGDDLVDLSVVLPGVTLPVSMIFRGLVSS